MEARRRAHISHGREGPTTFARYEEEVASDPMEHRVVRIGVEDASAFRASFLARENIFASTYLLPR